MSEGSSNTREISLGDDFGDVTVKVNGVRVEIHTNGGIDAHTNGPVQVHSAANDDTKPKVKTAPQVGDEMKDGTIYAGISPDTGKPMCATPEDAPLTMKWRQAMKYAEKLDAHGHKDWRVPTKGELNVLFRNRAAIAGFTETGSYKGFNETGSYPAGWYWSSSQNAGYAWAQNFSCGHQHDGTGGGHSSLRCVR